MSRSHELVLVLDADGHFAEYVEPAVARKALKECLVRAVDAPEFTIQMPKGMTRVPRLFGRRHPMLDKFSKLFEAEQPLYVKTLVPGQVSFEIPTGPGLMEPVLVPASGDPLCITDRAPFDAIKRCTDLRYLAKPRVSRDGKVKPAAIVIMTEDEVIEHYAKKAVRLGMYTPDGEPDVERAAQPVITEPAVEPARSRVDLPKSKSLELMEQQPSDANLGDDPVMISEVVHPRVLAMCHSLAAEAPENQRQPADAVLNELHLMGDLNVESLNHIMANGYYKSVKTWARKELERLAPGEED